MEHTITVVGIGPGHPDYILPIAMKTIQSASVLVGSQRALDTYASSEQRIKCVDKNLTAVIEFIAKESVHAPVVVMVSGDPGFYSMLMMLRDAFSDKNLQVIPGISSMQLAFARLSHPWQEADLLSYHGRDVTESKVHYAIGKKLGILTDAVHNSQAIANILVKNSWPLDTPVALCVNLSYENEKIVRTTVQAAQEMDGFHHCVMVVGI